MSKQFVILKYLSFAFLVLIIFMGLNKFNFLRGSSFTLNSNDLAKIGLEYYLENYQEQIDGEELNAVVRNFGCHEEIHIYQGEKRMMRLVYYRGKIYELR